MNSEIEQIQKKIAYLTEQAERWEDDALRLMKERNEALRERDEARKEVCELKSYNFEGKISPKAYAELRKWDCYKEEIK